MSIPATSPRQRAIQAAQQLMDQKPVFIDTETTGIDRNSEIIEISIIDHDGQTLFDSLIRPIQPIPAETTRIHHITNTQVANAPTWPVVWPTIRTLIIGRMIAIYNEEFDLRMLQQTHRRYNLPWRDTLKSFCIMKLYAQFRSEYDPTHRSYRYFSLDAAGKQAGIALPNSHRARDDSMLARALLLYIASQNSPA
jgi:DNA polymerase III subunit epsilon